MLSRRTFLNTTATLAAASQLAPHTFAGGFEKEVGLRARGPR